MSSFRLVQRSDALVLEGERFTVKLNEDEERVSAILVELFGEPIPDGDQPDPLVIAS